MSKGMSVYGVGLHWTFLYCDVIFLFMKLSLICLSKVNVVFK